MTLGGKRAPGVTLNRDWSIHDSLVSVQFRCKQSFVARIESGQRRVDVPESVIIAQDLDVPAKHFFKAFIKAIPLGEKICNLCFKKFISAVKK